MPAEEPPLTMAEALREFLNCPTPESCMKHLLAVAPYHEGDEHMLVLGCILKMYHSHTLSMDKLKKIFWASPPGEPSELSLKVPSIMLIIS